MDKSWMDNHVFGAKDEPIEKLKIILSPSLHNQIQLFCGQSTTCGSIDKILELKKRTTYNIMKNNVFFS
jgi:hypothetical protein